MPFSTNIANWFSGGTRDRELRETRQAWEETEALWRRSPLQSHGPFDLSNDLLKEAYDATERPPAIPIAVEFAVAVEKLIREENIAGLEAEWSVIEGDVAVASEMRAMLTRRRRWCGNFDRMHAILRRRILQAYRAFFDALPENCFGAWDEGRESFEVPLIELLDDPADMIGQMILFAYDDDTLKFEVFLPYRETLVRNMLVASGLPPDANPHEHAHRMIGAGEQKGKTPRELVEMYLGGTPFAAVFELPVPFHVPDAMRFEHCHIVGGTGHGKTQLMQRMIHADLVAAQHERRSVVVIDSQGDLINKLVRLELFSPDNADGLARRLVIIDPSDVEFPASLNLFDAHVGRLAGYRPVDRERVLNGVVELYERFFGDLLGAELTQKQGVIFRYLARLMLAIPDATIHTLMRLMEDGKPFRPYMQALDGSARYFFETEFFHPSFAATKRQILKRLWGVLSTPAFERMFAQKDNKLDLFEAMNEGKIILVNTAKDLLKRDGSQVFGRFFIALLTQAALERSTLDPDDRTPTFVYVDEAQEYFDDSTETLLTQARKYGIAFHCAHQSLDQTTPRLRSALMSNTSLKCAGGVSAKDARALANELHTTPAFIEGMHRRGGRTEFAVWLKNMTSHALRLSAPLGFLERQPTMTEEAYDALLASNRSRYCGTLADVQVLTPLSSGEAPDAERPGRRPEPERPASAMGSSAEQRTTIAPDSRREEEPPATAPASRPAMPHEQGKGGPKHRYLQALVKELAEQQGFRAVIEAPIPGALGQVDVLLSRDGVTVAVEVSVTTPAEWERENIRKCLSAGFPRVALVLAKSQRTQGRYRTSVVEGLADEDLARLSILSPEDLPDFIASLAAPPEPSESIVKGYRVRVSRSTGSTVDAKTGRDALARIVAKSLNDRKD